MTRRRKQRKGFRRDAQGVGYALMAASCAACALWTAGARASLTPVEMEKEVLRISRHLKAVPDSVWEEIAGAQAEERYAIVQGDTLYDISKRLFGDPKYWPKIWALNNHSILNPHMIRPGVQIAFRAGTGTDVPMVTLVDGDETIAIGSSGEEPAPGETASQGDEEDDSNVAYSDPDARGNGKAKKKKKKRDSTEWMRLPAQRWERSTIRVRRAAIKEDFTLTGPAIGSERKGLTFDQTMIVTSEPTEELGEITSTTSLGTYPTLLETVFIRTEQPLQVGKVYAATSTPDPIVAPQGEDAEPQMEGYAYPYLGKIKIVDHKDDTYVGTVISSIDLIERGSRIVALPPAIGELEPIPMSKPLEAVVIPNRRHTAGYAYERSLVYLNRGSSDGVKPGHVFRIIQRSDRKTHVTFGASPPEAYAEMIVIQASDRYSAAIVTRSKMPIEAYEIATAMVGQESVKDSPNLAPEANELDQFPQTDQLKPQEKKDLDQLERWKSNPSPTPVPSPEPMPSPTAEPSPVVAPSPIPTESEPVPEPSALEPAAQDPATEVPPTAPGDGLPPPPHDMLAPPTTEIPAEPVPVPTSDPAIPVDPNADLPPPPPF